MPKAEIRQGVWESHREHTVIQVSIAGTLHKCRKKPRVQVALFTCPCFSCEAFRLWSAEYYSRQVRQGATLRVRCRSRLGPLTPLHRNASLCLQSVCHKPLFQDSIHQRLIRLSGGPSSSHTRRYYLLPMPIYPQGALFPTSRGLVDPLCGATRTDRS